MENNDLQRTLSTMSQHLGVIASGNQQLLEKMSGVIARLEQSQDPVEQEYVKQGRVKQEHVINVFNINNTN